MTNNDTLEIKIKAKTEGQKEISAMKAELEKLAKIEAFKRLKKEAETSKKAFDETQKRVAALAKEMKKGGTASAKLAKSFAQAKLSAKKLKEEVKNNNENLHKLRLSLVTTGINTKKLAEEEIKLKKSLKETRSELEKTAILQKDKNLLGISNVKKTTQEINNLKEAYKRLKTSGKLSSRELLIAETKLKHKTAELRKETSLWTAEFSKIKAGAAGLIAVGYAVVKTFTSFADYAQKMAEVNTLLDVSRERHAALSKEIVALSKEIPQTASELASAEYDILSAGINLNDSIKVLKLAGKAAIGGVTNTKTAVQAGIGVLNAYSLSTSKLNEVYDLLFTTVKKGVTTFPELAASIGPVLPIARAADVDFRNVAAAIATMTKAGIRTPQAATALKSAIVSLSSPAPEAKKRFEELGITWKGLVPTIKAINKALSSGNLSKDGLRLLIPDVEARTAVLALTQNLDGLKDTLDDMDDATGAAAEAFDKMKDTPENQIKLFKNEISALAISMGGLLAKGLLPVLKTMRGFFKAISQVDPVTKTFLMTLTASLGVFALWKLGLGAIVLSLKATITSLLGAQAAMGSFAAQTAATKAMLAGGLVVSVVYTGYQLAKLISEMWQLHDVMKANHDASEMYKSDAQAHAHAANTEIKSKEELLAMSVQERDAYRQNLKAAMLYYSNMQASAEIMSTDAMLGGLLPFQSAKGKENEQKAKDLKKVTDKYAKALKEAAKVADEMSLDKPTKAIAATKTEIEAFEKAAKKAYTDASKKAEEYAQKVIAWEEKIKQVRMSTADKLRALSRKAMTDEEAWNDRRLQAEQKMVAAKQALREGDYKNAEALAKQAERLYSGLAEEVKSKEGGKDVVVKALKDSVEIAKGGIKEVGVFLESVYQNQKDKDAAVRDDLRKLAAEAKLILDELVQEREARIKITAPNLAEMAARLNDLAKPLTKIIYIKYVKTGSGDSDASEKRATGGVLPGYGGGDRVHALLEAGEGILTKEAVRKYGSGLVHLINSLKFKMPKLPKFQAGGIVSNMRMPDLSNVQRFADGGIVAAGSAPSETLIVRFQAGDVEAPVRITDTDSRAAMKKMAQEMTKMRLIYAR